MWATDYPESNQKLSQIAPPLDTSFVIFLSWTNNNTHHVLIEHGQLRAWKGEGCGQIIKLEVRVYRITGRIHDMFRFFGLVQLCVPNDEFERKRYSSSVFAQF